MPDRKIKFWSKFTIKSVPCYRCKCWHWSLKSLHTLFDTYLLAKFEPDRVVRNVQNIELFWQNMLCIRVLSLSDGMEYEWECCRSTLSVENANSVWVCIQLSLASLVHLKSAKKWICWGWSEKEMKIENRKRTICVLRDGKWLLSYLDSAW